MLDKNVLWDFYLQLIFRDVQFQKNISRQRENVFSLNSENIKDN